MTRIPIAVFLFGTITFIAPTSLVAFQDQPPVEQDDEQDDEQDQPQQEEQPVELMTYSETVVVTASKVETQIINAPAAVSVIGSDFIENAGAQNYGDLIRSVPGANVSQTSARDINITSRGATGTLSTTQLALLDGRTIYQDFFGFVGWDFLPIDTGEIAQIEIINGPASAVWGANAMTGVVNVITKTPRELDGTAVTLGFGAINRSAGQDLDTGTSYHVNVRHAQALNDRWAFKVSGGVFDMDPLTRPVGQVPIVVDPKRGRTGGGEYPAFTNAGTTQPKFDVRVDYDHPDGRQKVIFAGGIAGTQGIMHTGIGPFNILSGTVMGYGKVNYQRDNLRVNFFTNILDGEAPALLAIGTDGQPINFLASPVLSVDPLKLDPAATEIDETNECFGGMQSEAAMAEQPNLVVHAFEATIAESPSNPSHNAIEMFTDHSCLAFDRFYPGTNGGVDPIAEELRGPSLAFVGIEVHEVITQEHGTIESAVSFDLFT